MAALPTSLAAELQTIEDAVEYLRTITLEEAAAEILKLDQIEHADPRVVWPSALVVLDDGSVLRVAYQGPVVFTVGSHLRYEVSPDPLEVQDFEVPADNWWLYGGIGVGALTAGVGLGVIGDNPGVGVLTFLLGAGVTTVSLLFLR